MMKFSEFLKLRENDEEYWAKRMAQFQAASAGQKGAISDERGTVGTYRPQPGQQQQQQAKPITFTRDNYGQVYQTPDPDQDGDLYFHHRFEMPSSTGSYYYLDKATKRYMIRRPGLSRGWR